MGIPFPAKALQARLGRMSEMHTWASYLSTASQEDLPSPETLLLSSPKTYQVFPSLTGRVWSLSKEPQGCRDVQFALENAKVDEDRVAIASELHGHVREAIRCPHANHVIQMCIATMKPLAFQFIVDELMAGPTIFQAVRHKYGCRIVQRLLERAVSTQVHNMAKAILSDVYWIARHPYGNFVMQQLIKLGGRDHRHRICKAIERDIADLGKDTHGRAVISTAMASADDEDKVELARAVLHEPGLLVSLARSRHGYHAAKCVARVLDGGEREEARLLLSPEDLDGSRFDPTVPNRPRPKKRTTAVADHNGCIRSWMPS